MATGADVRDILELAGGDNDAGPISKKDFINSDKVMGFIPTYSVRLSSLQANVNYTVESTVYIVVDHIFFYSFSTSSLIYSIQCLCLKKASNIYYVIHGQLSLIYFIDLSF